MPSRPGAGNELAVFHHRLPQKDVHPFVSKHYRYALVGASTNPAKYGHIVFFDFLYDGFNVIPVNPKLQDLGGIPAFASLRDVKPPPDIAIVVVPPNVGIGVLDDAAAAGVRKLWFQPGAESDEIVRKAESLGLRVIADGSCIMVARRLLGI